MGCGESKIRKIQLTSEADWDPGLTGEQGGGGARDSAWAGLDTTGILPNR